MPNLTRIAFLAACSFALPVPGHAEERTYLRLTVLADSQKSCLELAPSLGLLLAGTNDKPVVVECNTVTEEVLPVVPTVDPDDAFSQEALPVFPDPQPQL